MRLDVTYKVTTPLFLGGADGKETAELRPPSLKGLLRFWFRAVALPRLGNWQAVSKLEKDLFGSSEQQAAFILSLEQHEEPLVVKANEIWSTQYGLSYLGYGVVDKGQTVRAYLKEGFSFTLHLVARRDIPSEQADLLVQATKALGLLGGAGARSRKGFGSLSLVSLRRDGREIWEVPQDVAVLRARIRELLGKLKLPQDGALPAYTAFSSHTRISIVRTDRDARRLLNDVGKELLRYRSYGSSHKQPYHALPWGERAEQVFAADHDLILDFLNERPVSGHPRRVVFGLPHNYYFLPTKQKASLSTKQKVSVEAVNHKRRASPLFIHVHALGSGLYAAILSVMPAVFLPKGERIKLSTGTRSVSVACQVDFRSVEGFLNRPAFQDQVVVWP
ncbi:MAG: type III-B CRISPR module RAMP protein Cmr1 [Bacillota bacterium]